MSEPREVEKEFRVRSQLGLHARPAGRLASLASRFRSEVSLGREGEWVSGSSVLSILCLAAVQGTLLTVRAVGEDADEAVAAVGELIEAVEEELASD